MKKLSNAELASFCGQLALILRSGISSTEGLSIMLEDTASAGGKALIQELLSGMEMGQSLYESVQASGYFPDYMCSMLELGEQSGRMDDVMQSLSDYYRREDELAHSIRSAVTYPLVMLGMMVAVMLVLIVKVLPVFDQVYRQLGAGLTGVSGSILRMGETLSRFSISFLLVALAVVAIAAAVVIDPKGRAALKNFSTRFFATKKLSEMIACGRFASGMYLALSSGLNIDEALGTVSRIVEHPVVGEKVERVRAAVAEGGSLSDAILETGLFTGVYARLINIGVKTGATDEVLHQISVQYDQEIEHRMAGTIAKLEPTLVALLSVAVGMILLSVMLPLMGIMSNIG